MNALPDVMWRVLDVTLVNTRNVFARQHPLSILDAVCKHAARRGGIDTPYFFHPVGQALPSRMARGGLYHLEVIFPRASEAEVGAFTAALQAHLADPRNNFRIQGAPTMWAEALTDRVEAFRHWAGTPKEVCLDFLTPFPFKPKNAKRRWLLSPGEFVGALCRRIERFYGAVSVDQEALSSGLELLPYYWNYEQHKHPSRSGRGVQYVHGMVGPLYIKGDIEAALPLVLAGERLHIGRRLAAGMGCYRVALEQPYFDTLLTEQRFQEQVADRMQRESDRANELEHDFGSVRGAVAQVCEDILDGCYEPVPATATEVPTTSGAVRRLWSFDAKDVAVQHLLHTLLAPVLEKMFEDASAGHRKGRSRETGRRMVMQAVREGYSHALEADIQSFWDEIPHEHLFRMLAVALPDSDRQTLAAVRACIECPVARQGRVESAPAGLAQGNALTPLLANLYLDTLDEQMEAQGYRLARYADRLIVLARSAAEAESARAALCDILARLGLRLNMDHAQVVTSAQGFSFLGRTYGLGLDDELEGEAPLRRTVTVTNRYAFVGVDHDALCVRKGETDLARVPLARVENIVMQGNNSLSARLVQKCVSENIPITFCSAAGHYVGTVQPDSKRHYHVAGRHLLRFERASGAELAHAARDFVTAKLANALQWLRGRAVPAQHCAPLADVLQRVRNAQGVAELRGYEGEGARLCFSLIQSLVSDARSEGGFASRKREPKAKADRWNTLLDCLYMQLFARLNLLVRAQGLNPYLGFLHSHKDNFESLVCDLQEPFRFRMDRLALRMVNKQEIRRDDFECSKAGRHRLTRRGFAKVVEAFERERCVQMALDDHTLGDLLAAQVGAVKRWVSGAGLEVYTCGTPMHAQGACKNI
ncbi:CRISPR-associated endonuclease Cas1 [Desulfobaculum sp.]